jgi:hypothetical protein
MRPGWKLFWWVLFAGFIAFMLYLGKPVWHS